MVKIIQNKPQVIVQQGANIMPVSVTSPPIVTALGDFIDKYMPGTEQGYAEIFTSATATATSIGAAVDVTGLSVTVTGTGRPVDVEFFCPRVSHSNATAEVNVALAATTLGTTSYIDLGYSSPGSTTLGNSLYIKRRVVLVDGQDYTFTARVFAYNVAGTSTLFAASYSPITLSVTAR